MTAVFKLHLGDHFGAMVELNPGLSSHTVALHRTAPMMQNQTIENSNAKNIIEFHQLFIFSILQEISI